MNKRAIATWTLALSVISLLMILLSYFGLIRYITLHWKSTEGYAKKYKQLPHATEQAKKQSKKDKEKKNNKEKDIREQDPEKNEGSSKTDDNKIKVVVSFTTTPERVKKLKPMLNSILDQTVRVDQIALNIPGNDPSYEIPANIKKIANVFKVAKDYGHGTNIIPVLARECEQDTVIIYIQDDVVYGKDLIESLMEESEKYPDDAIYCGTAVLVKPKFFDDDVLDHGREFFDENWIDNHLKGGKRKISNTETFRTYL